MNSKINSEDVGKMDVSVDGANIYEVRSMCSFKVSSVSDITKICSPT